MRYQPALDGLRAVCVGGVLVHHLAYCKTGGFFGVNVFFVLSGYLITRILLDDVALHGRVRLGTFYIRRARRLLPPVVLGCLLVAVAWPVLAKGSLVETSLAIVLYCMNWAMVYSRPVFPALTHFWSLAVEEQFYLVWPFAFVLLWRLGRARMLIGVVALIALNVGLRVVTQAPLLVSYFSTASRCDQLLVGCLAAMLHTSPDASVRARVSRVARWLAPAGALVILALFAFGHQLPVDIYRTGLSTLFAVLCAALIVRCASGEGGFLTRALSAPSLVWIGKRSYGIYVYQWPVVLALEVLCPIHTAVSLALVSALRVAVTLTVAWASYRFVESRLLAPPSKANKAAALAVPQLSS